MIYQFLKSEGFPDSNIILLIPENVACNPRNYLPGVVSCFDGETKPNIFHDVEVDYRSLDVSVDNFIDLLKGRQDPSVPLSKRLRTDSESRILVFVNGHGGNEYIKMQDTHVISAYELGKAFEELHARGGYKEILFISDSCQAFPIFNYVNVPNFVGIGSSVKDQYAFSYGFDTELGMSKTDRYKNIAKLS
eukprot:TRINITY_DN11509_c0_g1_i4.p1 TRINITY_DN11509_c0_g1~~TRINITY_DN11509_c0_g1_i4.p1  ORF type:complete len:191 (-),score=30.33 TRINITY_DN11509_c0_g1_i4:435-1007(-)